MTKICWDTALKIRSSNRLNSSKQPHAPTWHNPTKIRPIALKSNDSSQLNTNTKRPNMAPNILTLSVLPVPAGPGRRREEGGGRKKGRGGERGGKGGKGGRGGRGRGKKKKEKKKTVHQKRTKSATRCHPHSPKGLPPIRMCKACVNVK